MSKGMRYAKQVWAFDIFTFFLFMSSSALREPWLDSVVMVYHLQALLSGCSAGGLASILHCDEFRDLFPRTTKVKCLSDAGLFLDA